MLGLGRAPGEMLRASEPDESVGRLELRGQDARGAVGGDPLDLDVLERSLDRLAEPLAHAERVTRDLQAGKGEALVGAGARVHLAGDLPLDEERQLRVGDQAVDADLLPLEVLAVGAVSVALRGLAAQALLDDRDVVDGDDPAEPTATESGAGAHRLAERGLVR